MHKIKSWETSFGFGDGSRNFSSSGRSLRAEAAVQQYWPDVCSGCMMVPPSSFGSIGPYNTL